MKSDSLEVAILATIAYTDQFEFPLTEEEIFARLLAFDRDSELISQKQLNQTLKKMVKGDLLRQERKYYSLSSSDNLSFSRLEKETVSQKKWLKVVPLKQIIKYIPWIEGVFVTGSLAVNSAQQNDDIDILVITKKRRLWLSRLVLLVVSSLLGKRRAWNADVKGLAAVQNSWCFNLWLDADHLRTLKNQQNVYIAYEILQAKNILSRNKIEQKWLKANRWVNTVFPIWYQQKYQQLANRLQKKATSLNVTEILDSIFDWPLSVLDWLLFQLQHIYMKPHMTTERVGWGEAFFHPRNTKQLLFQKWNYSLVQLFAKTNRDQKKKVVLVTGVFDLLHSEHIQFLEKSKKTGDVLIVGVESDTRVRKMKGEGRPINSQNLRAENVRSLGIVDVVFILPEQFSKPADHERLISELKPSILAVSSHTDHLKEKRYLLKKYHGVVQVVHQHNPKISTTDILESAIKNKGSQ